MGCKQSKAASEVAFVSPQQANEIEAEISSGRKSSKPNTWEADATRLAHKSGNLAGDGTDALSSVALCFEGGGLKAFSVLSGVVGASLAAGAKYRQLQPKLAEVYSRFDLLSSVSGGTWFVASLAYSQHFSKMIEAIGADYRSAGSCFQKGWTERWMETTSDRSDLVKALEAILANSESGVSEALEKTVMATAELVHFVQNGFAKNGLFTWTDVVQALLNSGSLLPVDCQAGSEEVMHWAREKVWIINHIACTPTKGNKIDQPVLDIEDTKVHFVTKTVGFENAYYVVEKDDIEQLPNLLPAAFSVKLGAGPSAKEPCFYSSARCPITLKYSGKTYQQSFPCMCTCESNSAISSSVGVQDVSKLRVVDLAAASSAAASFVHCLPSFANDVFGFGLNLMPCVSNAPDGQAFRVGQALADKLYREGATQENLDSMANAGVHGLGDAAQVENTGIAGAVARGATEVVVLMCDPTPVNLTQLFEGVSDLGTETSAWSHTLFGDESLPIFCNPKAQEVLDAYNSEDMGQEGMRFKSLKVSGARRLRAIKVGSVSCTTTTAKWFGIRAGCSVTVHVLNVESEIDIFVEDFYRYSDLVQEIVNCIMDEQNADVVIGTLLPFLLGGHVLM